MSHRLVVLDTRDFERTLTYQISQWVEAYSEKYNKKIETPSLAAIRHITTIWITEILSSLLIYREPYDAEKDLQVTLFPTEELGYFLINDIFCDDKVDALWLMLNNQIMQHIAGDKWKQWNHHVQGNQHLLIEGIDYRISDWHERVYRGEIFEPLIREEDEEVEVNLASTFNYIMRDMVDQGYPQPDKTTVRMYILDVLNHLHLGTRLSTQYEHLSQYNHLIVKIYHLQIRHQLPDTQTTTCDFIITSSFKMMARPKKSSACQEEQRYNDLSLSMERGDWLPMRDRLWMQEYERTL